LGRLLAGLLVRFLLVLLIVWHLRRKRKHL